MHPMQDDNSGVYLVIGVTLVYLLWCLFGGTITATLQRRKVNKK